MTAARLRTMAAAILVAATLGQATAAENNVAGTVVRLQASAVAVRDAIPRGLAVGGDIYIGDVISTGKDARLEIRMIDGAVMTLGAQTNFVVIDYVFQAGQGNAALRLMTGAFQMVSGDLARLQGPPFKVETEVATIGIRGTTFWGGTIDGDFAVMLVEGAGVVVENNAGRVEITGARFGTTVKSRSTAPTEPRLWPEDKSRRATASVSFN